MSNKILVVAAHPDDEVLGCGGTIRRLANEGSDIYIAVLSAGVASRYGRGVVPDPKEIQAMIDVFKAVSLKLGAKDVSVADYPDNRFDSVSVLDVTKTIEACVDRWKPSVIFTHHCSDLNIDHHVTSRAVMTATRPVKGVSVRDIYSFEVPSSTEWTFGQIQPTFSPNVFYDITDTQIMPPGFRSRKPTSSNPCGLGTCSKTYFRLMASKEFAPVSLAYSSSVVL